MEIGPIVHMNCSSCGTLALLDNLKCQSCNGNPWRDASIVLPDYDCTVECGNEINNPFDLDVCEYNGYGFKHFGMYKQPKFWRYTKLLEKRYGKL